jgi:hypothetical protein
VEHLPSAVISLALWRTRQLVPYSLSYKLLHVNIKIGGTLKCIRDIESNIFVSGDLLLVP